MKFPSFEQIAHVSARTLRRFPVVLAVAVVGVAAALVLAESEAAVPPNAAFQVLAAALAGIPLLIGLALLSEKREWSAGRSLALQALGLLLLAAYAWSLPENIVTAPEMHAIRFALLAVGLHLFVAVAPWLDRGEENAFWQFNKTLFLRILSAALFTAVLYAGLALALAAVENLFDLSIPGKRYLQLWIVLTGLMTTWFFLAGIPRDLRALEAMGEYPKGIEIFTRYILLPLVLIYFLILLAYSGKILVTWSWPNGWVSRLILGFAFTGILALLLQPLRAISESRWSKALSRWFYVALAPLVLLYFLAVLRRLSDYGITEGRYIAIVIGIWLAVMVLYFLFSRSKSLKAIPLTLCVLSLLITVGPWGVFSISENSQVGRLKTLLENNELLESEKVRKSKQSLPYGDQKEISAVLTYLHDVHGYGSIQSWFGDTLRKNSPDLRSEWKDPSAVAAVLGIEYVAVSRFQSGSDISFNAAAESPMIVSGYDRAFPAQYFDRSNPDKTIAFGPASFSLNSSLDTLTFIHAGDGQPDDSLRIPLATGWRELTEKYHHESARDIPLESMVVEASGNRMKVKIYILMLRLDTADGDISASMIRLQLLYGAVPEMNTD